jgi:hypothetical protein
MVMWSAVSRVIKIIQWRKQDVHVQDLHNVGAKVYARYEWRILQMVLSLNVNIHLDVVCFFPSC